ncbi:MAG: potassium-transporting ATPase subunit KdpB [Thermomicrobiales bacterium]|nr:potassium-transporting ATPase subunit KdpB [Thermomicrobiales bacterium]
MSWHSSAWGAVERQTVLAAPQGDTATLAPPAIPGVPAPELPPREQWPSSRDSVRKAPPRGLFDPAIVRPALAASVRKLDPRHLWRNPVMLIVEIGAVITTVSLFGNLTRGGSDPTWFVAWIAAWLCFTVLFANFAEAMAEGRGKAQAETLRRTRTETLAKVLVNGDARLIETRPSGALRPGDLVLVEAGDIIPSDGEVIAGVAYVSEAAITGESAPVLKEPGTDIASSVTGGTQIISDALTIRITAEPGKTFLDRMIALVEGAERQKTPNEIALNILLAGLTIIFLIVVVTLRPLAHYAGAAGSITILIALLVTLIPTTIGALLSAIGIAGMDRLVQRNVLAMSGRAVEAAGDVDVLLLDKTGTITFGSRMASEFIPAPGVPAAALTAAALRSSLADETPEGKSIVALAEQLGQHADRRVLDGAELIPFTAETRMSGIRLDGHATMKGAVDAIDQIASVPGGMEETVRAIAAAGATPLVVAEDGRVLGAISLKDTVKPGIRQRFEELRAMGIRTIMITGDNPLTARTIADEASVDDFVAEARPEDKIRIIRENQAQGRLVAMTGDGTNDAPALAQADVGVAMNTGTAAAKEAGNMVDLDSDPTKLIEIVAIGKQLLMTRGALTTFSIANDVAKYFAILPAMFLTAYAANGGSPAALGALNVMRLSTPYSAILSAIIFNAVIIVALIPLALRGVAYRPLGAAALLRRNLLIYGVGGLIAPFVGIKLIDLLLTAVGLT